MVTSIVSMLMEGGMNGFDSGSSLTLEESNNYTLEAGAALIARQSVQELHEIFEVAIVQTNEAVLGAYMEGCSDVMESATYGPIFEASEKSAGRKIMDFLIMLKDRVFAFFRNIIAKISEIFNDYEKFFKKKKDDMVEAEKERGSGVRGVKVKNWNDDRIDSLSKTLQDAASTIEATADECVKLINDAHDSIEGKGSQFIAQKTKMFNDKMDKMVNKAANGFGIGSGKAAFDIETTEIQSYCQKVFERQGDRVEEITVSYVEHNLVNTKNAIKSAKDAQKKFNDAYNNAIKKIKKITDDMESDDKKGYKQFMHKATSTMSKIQTITNAYATAGYRALVGRANESKALCGVIISGKAGKRKAD